jgi:hypothetical protein
VNKRIYVAGASANIEQIEHYIKQLKEAGWAISFDWTVPVRTVGDASPDDPKIRREAALADLEGVATSDVMWLVQPHPTSTSTGAWVELGAALRGREIYKAIHAAVAKHKIPLDWSFIPLKSVSVVASGSSKRCIFTDLADYRFQSDDDAFEFITKTLAS